MRKDRERLDPDRPPMTARRQVGRFVEVADGVWQVEGVVTLLRRPDGSWRVRFASTTAVEWTAEDAANMACVMGWRGAPEPTWGGQTGEEIAAENDRLRRELRDVTDRLLAFGNGDAHQVRQVLEGIEGASRDREGADGWISAAWVHDRATDGLRCLPGGGGPR